MENNDINNLSDLFNFLYPAFQTKCDEFKQQKINITPILLWNYLKRYKWCNKKELALYEMVNDIMDITFIDLKLILSYQGDKNEN